MGPHEPLLGPAQVFKPPRVQPLRQNISKKWAIKEHQSPDYQHKVTNVFLMTLRNFTEHQNLRHKHFNHRYDYQGLFDMG